jgi:predicted aldo/keto reductase-like oxidoreductase
MRHVILGKSGLEVSAVGFGGIPIQRVPPEEAARTIRRALELGVDFIDTASGYGDSQRKIGLALKGWSERVVLASKSGARNREGILGDIERSREEMGRETIDLYQLHGVSSREAWEQVRAPGGALEGLFEARERGWIGHVGVSSHSLDLALELVEHEAMETLQFPFNLVTREPADELVPKARSNGLGFIAMKPLCGGEFDDAGLAFRFLNGFPEVVAIPGIEKPEEIEEIVGIVEPGGRLEGEDETRAAKIAAELGKLFCRRCGYCEPCPNGVPIQTAMILESCIRRMPRDQLVPWPAKVIADGAPNCTECGECESKCPYELPIAEIVKRSLEKARAIVADRP